MKRRSVVALLGLASLSLGGCGFKLRGAQTYTFQTLAILPNPGGPLAIELRRSFGDSVRVLAPNEPFSQAQVVLDILQEQREKTVVGVSSSGQVREFQLRIRVKFRVRNRDGDELTPPTELVQQRDMSFSESAVLAKEAEEVLLYRDMQSDMVQQLMRRLAAIK
ncbi:LPS assembly lipoprotein LptE [Rhodoferax ferrireducens]|uniref:LPS-assembly lipoprotein LptE n=1 Tax=Rhodoferax ferrireducens TaxID=192843 RepID=UPI00298D6B41|nr:LPS assembly lipoprotein LptE [Rhodoferax ferrireducens]WPC67726.1 LPS assembly lipoprotein LptE [Rhodoferax ferrireducens]